MNVTLIDCQMNALDLLLYTKNTRLDGAQSLEEITMWPQWKKKEHLDYMRKTIASSWEFVNYTFEIKGVSRVFTHQLVRTRQAAYAQQSQRTVKAEDGFINPCDDSIGMAETSMRADFQIYENLVEYGEEVQNARYVLPMGTKTNIIMGVNLRALSHMAELRLCKRTAGEYQEVFKEMIRRVVEVHPWADDFLKVYCVKTGMCAFPNYKECPVQQFTINVTDEHKAIIEKNWKEIDHVANPVAKDGKTQ